MALPKLPIWTGLTGTKTGVNLDAGIQRVRSANPTASYDLVPVTLDRAASVSSLFSES